MRKLTEEFLLEVFCVSFKERTYFHIIRQHLKSNYIADEDYRRLWEQITKYYAEKKINPTIGTLIQRLTSDTKNNNDAQISLLKEIDAIIISKPDKVIDQFEEFIKESMFIDMYQATGKLFNENQREKAYDMYRRGSEEIEKFTLAAGKFERVFADFWDRNTQRSIPCDNAPFQIPFNIPDVDEACKKGAWSGETELWTGDSGMGKSKLLVCRSVDSARLGFNVLHVVAEDTRAQATANFDACWTGKLYGDIRKGEMPQDAIETWSKIIKNIGGEIYVKYAEQEDEKGDTTSIKITWNKIRQWITELRKAGITIHHVVIDYLDLIELDGDIHKYGTGSEGERLRQLEGCRQIKAIAKDFNVLATTATQSSDIPDELRDDEKFVLSRHYLGNAKRKIEPFSYHFTINQSRRERGQNIVRVHCDKMREHESHQTWRWKQSLKNSRFYDRMGTIAFAEELANKEADEQVELEIAEDRALSKMKGKAKRK